MAKSEKTKMSQHFMGLKSEFTKISWPKPKDVGRQSTAVVVATVVVALIIILLDMVIRYGVDFLVNL